MNKCPACGNRKVYGWICLNCGYDFRTKTPRVSPAEQASTKMPAQLADIWLGTFPSRRDFNRYFREAHGHGDDEPVSPFARDQGILFYDHDFFVAEYFPLTTSLEEVIGRTIVLDDLAREIVTRYQESGIGSFNFIAMQLDELSSPDTFRSVAGENYAVHYLGRFAYSGMKG